MKMSKLILLIAVFLSFSCGNEKSKEKIKVEKVEPMSFEVLFYPVGVPEDVRYSIGLKNNVLTIVNHRLRSSTDVKSKSKQLSPVELEKIKTIVANIKQHKSALSEEISDTWAVKFILDDKLIYEEIDFSIEDSQSTFLKTLIKYSEDLTGFEIDLYSFS